jgi:predicted MFS family arabinose efflux permease
MIYDLVGANELASGIALQSAAFNLARVIGPVVGSLLYAGVGPAWCFFANGISFAAIILSMLFIRTDLSRRAEPEGTVWAGFLEGISHLRENRLMRSVVSLTAVTSLCAFSAYTTLMPAFARDMLKLSEDQYGFLFSALGLGSLLGAFLVGRAAAAERRGHVMYFGAFLFALALFALGRTNALFAALPLLFLVGLAAISELATANTLTQSLAPDHLRGRAVSVHMFAMAGLQPLGSYLAGALAERTDITTTLTLGASVLLVFTAGLLLLRPEVWRLE